MVWLILGLGFIMEDELSLILLDNNQVLIFDSRVLYLLWLS